MGENKMKNTNTYNGTDLDLLARNAYRTLIGELRNEKFDVQGNNFSHVYGTGLVPFNRYINSANLVVSCLDGDGFAFSDANSKIDKIVEIGKRLNSFGVYISECMANGSNKSKIFLNRDYGLSKGVDDMLKLKKIWHDDLLITNSLNHKNTSLSINDMSLDYTIITGENIPERCRFNLIVLPYSHNFEKKEIAALTRGDYSINGSGFWFVPSV
jgi:hypothetical protein